MELGGAGRGARYLLMEAAALLEHCFPGAGGHAEQFVALSGKRGLRWILPAHANKITSLLGAWQPYTLKAQINWGVIRAATRGGFLGYLPGAERFVVDISSTDWGGFGWTEDEQPHVLAYVGTTGQHQKLVVTLADPESGEGKMVVKFPLIDTAWLKIVSEYEVLLKLQSEGSNHAPMPLCIDHEKQFSVQHYMPGKPVGIAVGSAHYAFLASLIQSHHVIDLDAVRAQLVERYRTLSETDKVTGEQADQLERVLAKTIWNRSVLAVRLHGDFAPWNLKWQTGGILCAVDWEDSHTFGLPFYDLYFYIMQVKRLLGRDIKVDRGAYINALFDAGYEGDDDMLVMAEQLARVFVAADISREDP